MVNAIIRLKNEPYKRIKKLSYCTLFDGAHGFKLWSYYITPEEQIRQLKRLGFRDIKGYSLKDGLELKRGMDQAKDPWIHYLCEK